LGENGCYELLEGIVTECVWRTVKQLREECRVPAWSRNRLHTESTSVMSI